MSQGAFKQIEKTRSRKTCSHDCHVYDEHKRVEEHANGYKKQAVVSNIHIHIWHSQIYVRFGGTYKLIDTHLGGRLCIKLERQHRANLGYNQVFINIYN